MPATLPIQFLDGPEDTRIAYAAHGDGPLLVCPAWWVSHLEEDWKYDRFRNFFERLASSHTVVRYDRPGVGLSDGERETPTLESEVAVLEAVLNHLGARSTALFAISCAGPPALAFAARHPGKVERIAFYGSYSDGSKLAAPGVKDAMSALVAAHWGVGSQTLASIFNPQLSGEELQSFGRRQRAAAKAPVACRLLQLTYEMDASPFVLDIACPTLLVHRRGDRAIPLEAGRKLASSLPKATFISLEGAVHLPWEGDDDVIPVLEPFFSPGRSSIEKKAPKPDASCCFDDRNRELVIQGERRSLTPLEYGLLAYLAERTDQVVTRDEALRDVWQTPFGGSNVVDAVVRTLRRKLGPGAAALETVKGHGYRWRGGLIEMI